MKRILAVLLIASLLVVPARAEGAAPPAVSAGAWCLYEPETGAFLAAENALEPMLIASTTKIMTAIVAMERLDADMPVAVDAAWCGAEGSSMYLTPSESYTVRDLYYGLLLASGNDAALALASITAGGVEEFAALMNEKALSLGCGNTSFKNPSGLDEEGHYSCARDLALIMAAALDIPLFRDIAAARSHTAGGQTLTNHNRLLSLCEGCTGGKTGYTLAAGRTLVSAAVREGMTLICVTLRDRDDWRDHCALYDWGYAAFDLHRLAPEQGLSVPVISGLRGEAAVAAGEELALLTAAGESFEVRVELPPFVYAPVERDGRAGYLRAWVDGAERASVELVYSETVPADPAARLSPLEKIKRFLRLAHRLGYIWEG